MHQWMDAIVQAYMYLNKSWVIFIEPMGTNVHGILENVLLYRCDWLVFGKWKCGLNKFICFVSNMNEYIE